MDVRYIHKIIKVYPNVRELKKLARRKKILATYHYVKRS
ncbi:hypothetical protein B4077_2291 [Bacillus cereus]|uniref:Uncharacterized protein n=1 Tax=Bacillus cereus TaxID=1396 RepID=A0A0G8ETQ3_BACCE|nr:hypothetical protein B4077_2291 [Bacillus cereus]